MSLKAQSPVIREQRGSKKATAAPKASPKTAPEGKTGFTLVQKKYSLLRKRG